MRHEELDVEINKAVWKRRYNIELIVMNKVTIRR